MSAGLRVRREWARDKRLDLVWTSDRMNARRGFGRIRCGSGMTTAAGEEGGGAEGEEGEGGGFGRGGDAEVDGGGVGDTDIHGGGGGEISPDEAEGGGPVGAGGGLGKDFRDAALEVVVYTGGRAGSAERGFAVDVGGQGPVDDAAIGIGNVDGEEIGLGDVRTGGEEGGAEKAGPGKVVGDGAVIGVGGGVDGDVFAGVEAKGSTVQGAENGIGVGRRTAGGLFEGGAARGENKGGGDLKGVCFLCGGGEGEEDQSAGEQRFVGHEYTGAGQEIRHVFFSLVKSG